MSVDELDDTKLSYSVVIELRDDKKHLGVYTFRASSKEDAEECVKWFRNWFGNKETNPSGLVLYKSYWYRESNDK